MKKRVLSLFLAITLCLTLTPTGALAAEGQPLEQTVTVTQEAQTGADENAPPANPEENPTENAPAAAEKNNTTDEETGKETGKEAGKEAGQNEPTVEGENEPLALGLDDAAQNAAEGENGEGSGGTHYVAESGGTQYETVQDILDNMEEEITLLDSVTEDLTVSAETTIHMNGHSITGNIDATDSLTLTNGTVKGNVEVDGGTFTMTAPAEAEAAITGGLKVVSGSAFVSGAQVGVKGTLYFDGTDMLISGAVKAVELNSAAEPAAKTLYGSATVNGDTAAEAGFDTDTYKVGGEIAKKLTNKQVGSTTPAAPSLTLTETSKSLTAGKTAVFTANYTGTDTLNAYVQGSAVNGYFTISQKNNGDGTYTVSVKIDEETPGGTYTLFVHELGNTSVQASATITVTGLPDAAEVNGKQYKSLPRALDAAQDGDTVKLLGDAEVTKWHSLSKAFTLELNGKTVTTQSMAELYLHARVIVQDSSTGETGGMAGTALLNVQEGGDLIIKSGTFNGRIAINAGKLTIEGGTFNQEVDLRRGDSDSVFFSGGTFAKIWYPNSSGSFLDLLADGCAFYGNDGKLVNVAEITGPNLYNVHIGTHAHSFTNGACGCGYTCPHTSVDESGACTVCGKQFAASITEGDDVTYYDTFNSALVYAYNNDGCTLKLLADVTEAAVMINNPFIFDLNGHNVDVLSVDARATIKDSGTKKGKIGKVTVSTHKVTDLTLGDLLEEGYAFQYENGHWANDSHLQTSDGLSVTVEKAPIQSVKIYAKDKNNKEVSTIAYGTTGEVTLVSSCRMGKTSGADLSYLWYKLEGLAATAPLEGATGANYTLPDNLTAGTHTYLLICTSDGYSKSKEITITVTPISLEDATVTVSNLTYNGNPQEPTVTVKLGDKTLSRDNDYTVQVTNQTDAGSYKLTIKGGGNYSGTIEKDWKIEPLPISLLSVSSISKTYDGSADVTLTADKLTFFSKTASRQDITLPNTALTFSDAQFTKQQADGSYLPSPEVGGGKALSFTMTLTSNNYVFEGKSEDTTEVSDVFATDDVNRFTITKAAAPTNIPSGTLNIINGTQQTYIYDFKKLLPELSDGEYGTVSYGNQAAISVVPQRGYYYDPTIVEFKNGKLILAQFYAKDGEMTGQIGTVKVTVTTTNYNNFQLTLVLNAINKPTPDDKITASDITYGQALSASTITGTMKDPTTGKEITGTFTWTDGTVKPNAGSHNAEWIFTPDESYGGKYTTYTDTATVKVNPKAVTVNITPNGGTYGSVTAAAAKLSGAVEGDNVPVTLTYTGNGYNSTAVPTNAGSYTVTASIADSNYVLTGETTANFVIEPKSIKGATVVLGKALTANGAEQTQTVEKILLDGKEIPADSYTVTGNTATDPGSHKLTITAKGNYTGTVKQTYVIIPAKAADAPGAEVTIGSGEVKVVVKSEGAVPPATLLTDKAELLAMLVDSGDITADELAQIADGASVDIVLTVKEANVPDEVKTAMAQAAKGYTIGQYLDISLFKYMTVNGKQQDGVALHTTKNALTISVAVPDALINTNSAVNRTYCIVRNHEGTIDVLDAVFDAASKTLTFKTDRFSDYAIAYKDTAVPSSSNPGSNNSSNGSETKKNEVAAPTPAPTPASTSKPSTVTAMPQTGDTSNPTLYVVLLVASLLGLAVVFVCKKRNDK